MVTTLPLIETFRADGSAVSEVRMFVRARAEQANLPADTTGDLLIGVSEACNEMLAHEQAATLLVSWWAHDDVVEIRLKDEDVIASLHIVQEFEDEGGFGNGGLGFPHIFAFVDEYTVRPGTSEHPSTTIRLIKETSPS
jgi:anti-sigma regulatory factor (Ser/Thr protein kinase)